jgi:hypothetical protein
MSTVSPPGWRMFTSRAASSPSGSRKNSKWNGRSRTSNAARMRRPAARRSSAMWRSIQYVISSPRTESSTVMP